MNKRNPIKVTISGKVILCIIIALTVLSSLVVSGIIAKYIISNDTQGAITSPNFYFTSDVLSETTPSYTLNPGENGRTEISFVLRNFADELRIADKDISFSVAVTPSDNVTVKVNGAVGSTGTLSALSTEGSSASITVSGLKNGETYVITATGNAGFESSISAMVQIKPDEQAIYKHVDDSSLNYVLLTVWTTNLAGDVKIDFPAGLIPDATDGVMSGVHNYSDGSYMADSFTDGTSFDKKYSSHVYRFFKTTDTEYTVDGFKVSIGGVKASEGSPE